MEKRIIGITGGVGSGKSTVLEYLEKECGACIIQADLVARELMEPGGSSYRAVAAEFGEGILASDGSIDRGALAAIVFSDEEKLARLNALTHPLVKEEVQRRMAQTDKALVVFESAIPREARMRDLCDEIWFVHVPVETRIERLMASRGYSRQKCQAIMDNQLADEVFAQLADHVIENGGSPEETRKQVAALLQE